MFTLEHKNKSFACRSFDVKDAQGNTKTILVSVESLEEQLDLDGDEEDITLDETIYYYVPDSMIHLPAAELVNNNLDGHYTLVGENIAVTL